MAIRDLRPEDWPQVASIYAEGIATGDATFEVDPPSWEEWDAAHPSLRLVAVEDGLVLGWAALSRYSDRCCYRGVAEESVYVGASARGRGIGRALLAALVDRSEAEGIWTLQAGIFPENRASWRFTRRAAFAWSASASASARSAASGGTSSCSSAARRLSSCA